jgi:hypothetical protein
LEQNFLALSIFCDWCATYDTVGSPNFTFKMLGGYPAAFCMPIKAFLNAWWVSTSLFNANKRLLKCLVGIDQPFLCQ